MHVADDQDTHTLQAVRAKSVCRRAWKTVMSAKTFFSTERSSWVSSCRSMKLSGVGAAPDLGGLVGEPHLHQRGVGLGQFVVAGGQQHALVAQPAQPLEGVGFREAVLQGIHAREVHQRDDRGLDVERRRTLAGRFELDVAEESARGLELQRALRQVEEEGVLALAFQQVVQVLPQLPHVIGLAVRAAEVEEDVHVQQVLRLGRGHALGEILPPLRQRLAPFPVAGHDLALAAPVAGEIQPAAHLLAEAQEIGLHRLVLFRRRRRRR